MAPVKRVNSKPINEVKDHLSRVVAEVEATGEEVQITRHGRVVARIVPVPPAGVRLGAGARDDVDAPTIDDLAWTDADLAEFDDAGVNPA